MSWHENRKYANLQFGRLLYTESCLICLNILHDFLCSVCIILPFIFNHQVQKFFKYLRKIQTNDKNNYNNDNNNNKFTSMIFIYLHSFIHRFTGLLGTNIIAISQLACQLSWQSTASVSQRSNSVSTGLNFFLAKVRVESILCPSISNATGNYFFRWPPPCKHNNFGPPRKDLSF